MTLNRPEKRNALSIPLLAEIEATLNRWRHREDLVVAVLTGAGGKAFASGGDLSELANLRTTDAALSFASGACAALESIRSFPIPVIAALNGVAFGGGAELAVACDLRIAARHSRIGFLQGSLNISTAWGGGTDLLQLLPINRALQLLCSAEVLDASTAKAIGLFDEVASDDDFGEAVKSFVGRFSSRKPQVMRAFKTLAIMRRSGADREGRLAVERALFAETWVHEDHWSAPGATGVGR